MSVYQNFGKVTNITYNATSINPTVPTPVDSQYILNWLASGGDQSNTNAGTGNDTVSPAAEVNHMSGDASYNIKNNCLGYNLNNSSNYNLSVRDAQYNLNIVNGVSGYNRNIKYQCLPSIIPGENIQNQADNDLHTDFRYSITTERGTGNITSFVKNKVYLKLKEPIRDISAILTNKLSLLHLTSGNIIKRYDGTDYGIEIGSFQNSSSTSSTFTKLPKGNTSLGVDYPKYVNPTNNILHHVPNINNIFPPKKSTFDRNTTEETSENYNPLDWYSYVTIDNTTSNDSLQSTVPYYDLLERGTSNVSYNESVQSNLDLTVFYEGITDSDPISNYKYNILANNNNVPFSWCSPGATFNNSQAHLIGQFVFDTEANGVMVLEYNYGVESTSTYSAYFEIKEGQLKQFLTPISGVSLPSISPSSSDTFLYESDAKLYANICKINDVAFVSGSSSPYNYVSYNNGIYTSTTTTTSYPIVKIPTAGTTTLDPYIPVIMSLDYFALIWINNNPSPVDVLYVINKKGKIRSYSTLSETALVQETIKSDTTNGAILFFNTTDYSGLSTYIVSDFYRTGSNTNKIILNSLPSMLSLYGIANHSIILVKDNYNKPDGTVMSKLEYLNYFYTTPPNALAGTELTNAINLYIL